MTVSLRFESLSGAFHKYHIEGAPFTANFNVFTDIDRGDPHDHPFGFQTTIIYGGYVERVFAQNGSSRLIEHRKGDSFFIPATHIHRIEELFDGECWSLMEPGPWERTPGFWNFQSDGSYFREWHEDEFRKVEP